MPRWSPSPIWSGQDAYVVGGGTSLRSFDWDSIRGKNVIGCNSAFVLGTSIVKVLIFGDWAWWLEIGAKRLPEFGGLVVGTNHRIPRDHPGWLLTMDRHNPEDELGTKDLGWFGNTGAAAVNLALILGARRVFLLGFDMKVGPKGKKDHNWHDLRYEEGNPQAYVLFRKRFEKLAKSLPKVFPGCEVVNVTNDSDLDLFPKVSIAEHFARERQLQEVTT